MIKKAYLLTIGIVSMSQAIPWENWAGNQQCTVKLEIPSTISELVEIIKKAKKEKAPVRAYGSGHSWSDIVCTEGYLVNTDSLNKVIAIDTTNKLATVQAGIKLKDLNKKLAKKGLCLSNQTAITEQSLAGVISTGTHGSGKTGTFASFITQLQLVTADAKLYTISATENSDLFNAARTSIGSLGILTQLTVQCEPLFKVERHIMTTTWPEIFKNYQNLLSENDYMQFYWDASDDSVEVIIHNRIKNTKKSRSSPHKTGYSYSMLSGQRGSVYMEEEIAIPRQRFAEAAQAVRALIQEEFQKSPLFSGVLFRFVSADKQNFLSPASDQDVVFFSITTRSRSGYEPFYKKFYEAMLPFGGRPHWGKINYVTNADAKKLYGQHWEKFITIRKKLDPDGMFSNAFTKRLFGW